MDVIRIHLNRTIHLPNIKELNQRWNHLTKLQFKLKSALELRMTLKELTTISSNNGKNNYQKPKNSEDMTFILSFHHYQLQNMFSIKMQIQSSLTLYQYIHQNKKHKERLKNIFLQVMIQ